MFGPSEVVGGGFFTFAMVYWIAILLVHAIFAVAVYKDATSLPDNKLVLVGPVVWTLATLLTGVVGACGYWVLHHSLPQLLGARDEGHKPP